MLLSVAAARLGRQLLCVSRDGFHDLGSGLTAEGVENRDRVTGLVIAHARIVRLFLPIGAQRVALDPPVTVPDGLACVL